MHHHIDLILLSLQLYQKAFYMAVALLQLHLKLHYTGGPSSIL